MDVIKQYKAKQARGPRHTTLCIMLWVPVCLMALSIICSASIYLVQKRKQKSIAKNAGREKLGLKCWINLDISNLMNLCGQHVCGYVQNDAIAKPLVKLQILKEGNA